MPLTINVVLVLVGARHPSALCRNWSFYLIHYSQVDVSKGVVCSGHFHKGTIDWWGGGGVMETKCVEINFALTIQVGIM